jgi:FixJ family two-component response regulator
MVVVVEDDVATLKGLARVLRAGGFDAVCYGSAEEFLVSPPTAQPVCLVLDINLGGMSGLDLLRRLRALRSSLSVIVITGDDDARIREEAYQLGCAGYLSKQSDAELLLELIRSLMRATWPRGIP